MIRLPESLLRYSGYSLFFIIFFSLTGFSAEEKGGAGNFKIGWASYDITPSQPVLIRGQFHARVSEGIMDPLTVTALALESGSGVEAEKSLMISCDLIAISDDLRGSSEINLRDNVRKLIIDKIPELDPSQIVLNATHTHSGPLFSNVEDTKSIYGITFDVMSPADCLRFLSERIADAAVAAWENRKPGGISYGISHAVISHNRLQADFSGRSRMYGDFNREEFSHIEGFEDHSVNLLYTWDERGNLTGIMINVASPSQVSEQSYRLSADFWHDTRVELRRRFGKDLYVFAQCSAAGDKSPHVMVGSRAEERMRRIKFPGDDSGRGSSGHRKQIALRISDAVESVFPYMKDNIDFNPVLIHRSERVPLSRRLISMEDVENALKESREWQNRYNELLAESEENPSIKEQPRWYRDITSAYSRTRRGESVRERYELEKVEPYIEVEVHVIRIGDIAIATNPFELYLDYGVRMKARSPALQTFVVQLAGGGSYLPTTRSIAGGAYGAVPASTLIGPEGGTELVEATLEMMKKLW